MRKKLFVSKKLEFYRGLGAQIILWASKILGNLQKLKDHW